MITIQAGTTQLDASKITAATRHTALGYVVITYKDVNNATKTINIPGQDGLDLYTALAALASATLTSTT